MSRAGHPRKDEIVRAITKHIEKYGPSNWSALHEQFPDIPVSTLNRYAARIKKGMPLAGEIISDAQRKIRDAVGDVERWTERARTADATQRSAREKFDEIRPRTVENMTAAGGGITDHLPTAPSPAVIAARGADAMASMDFMKELQDIYADANTLKAWASTPDGKVRAPMFFKESIKLRRDLLETYLHAMDTVYDLRRQQQFYDAIMAVVADAAPELQQEIIQRLEDLNSRMGMTIKARV